jgi:MoaA/NifB/PqqE/SkfB family radical SAM enzyme
LISCDVLYCGLEDSVKKLRSEFEVLDVIVCDRNTSTVDLYVHIKKLYRKCFKNNQRIVFVITEDTDSSGTAGQILQDLQCIINDIDISNFFVCLITTNPDIIQDYQHVFENISQDQVPFHLYQCHGDYKRISKDNITSFSKYASLKNISDQIDELRDDQKDLLFKSKTFCMLAWTGINIEPDSRVRPCCAFQGSTGRSDKDSISIIWNSNEWKKVRKDMLNGVPVDACGACYDAENLGRDTLRTSSNRLLIDKIDVIDSTRDDGYLEVFHLNYWDVRYNNLCNLTCRSCNPGSSSSWYEPAVSLGKIQEPRSPILLAGRTNNDIFDQIVDHIDHVKQIYFAGGEPSMIDKFYEILEILDSQGRNDVRLCYNINMSRLTLRNKSLLDLWKKFPNVSIGASLDGEHQRGEYLRQGLSWKDVIANRKLMQDQCPHIDFYINATVSILNVLHVPEFHKSWVDLHLIRPEDFNIHLLFSPKYLRVDYSPAQLKEKIYKTYIDHIDWVLPRDSLGRATYGFRSVLSYIENNHAFDQTEFWQNVDALDQYHNTCMTEVFPELQILPR